MYIYLYLYILLTAALTPSRATEFLVRRELSHAAGVDAAAYRHLMAILLQAHARRRAQRHTLTNLRRADMQLKALAEARRMREEAKDRERAETLTRTDRAFGHGVSMRSVNGTMRSVGGGFVPAPPGGGSQVSLYKILFYLKTVLWESIIILRPPPTYKAYPIALLLRDHCARYARLPTPSFYAIHSQGTPRTPRRSRAHTPAANPRVKG